jgi:hypothetical protein
LGADHSDRHESRLHKLGIKVKIAAIGGLPVEKRRCRLSELRIGHVRKIGDFSGPCSGRTP